MPTPQNLADLDMREARAKLERLERKEWLRWTTALVIILLLTFAVFALTAPMVTQDMWDRSRMEVAERALLGIVLLFGIFIVYQRLIVGRMRWHLAMQIATVATLEALKPLSPEESVGYRERRRWQRRPIDELLKVIATGNDKEKLMYGRVRDISENGVGAVIPDTLNVGETVTLKFTLGRNSTFTIQAMVRHKRGFHYGFEFLNMGANTAEQMKANLAELPAS